MRRCSMNGCRLPIAATRGIFLNWRFRLKPVLLPWEMIGRFRSRSGPSRCRHAFNVNRAAQRLPLPIGNWSLRALHFLADGEWRA
jgi:hypothetical protein